MFSEIPPKKKARKKSLTLTMYKSSGFALMVALGLMSFVLVVIVGLTTLVQVNSKISTSGEDVLLAKQNALFALNLAIGDLQNEMGPDQRISATASILDEFPETEEIDGVNNPYWTGTWSSNDSLDGIKVDQVISKNRSFSDGKPSNFRRWLVSSPLNRNDISTEEKIEFAKNFSKDSEDAVQMVGAGTVGNESTEENSVYVPRQITSTQLKNENGYAYWVGDEGVKSRIAGSPQKPSKSDLDKILSVNNAGSPRLNAIEGFADAEDISKYSDKMLTLGTAQFTFNEVLEGNVDIFKNKFHSLSTFSRGLMVDVKHGGIRKDLSLLFASGSLPMDYDEQPIYEYDSALGPSWNYALRYHNIYKRIRNKDGRNFLKTSDFWDDADTDIDASETKYTDIPIPVLARMQVIFSLHKQRNTFNGKRNNQLMDDVEISEPRLLDLSNTSAWIQPDNDDAEIVDNAFGFGTDFIVSNPGNNPSFSISDQVHYPFKFDTGGSVFINTFNLFYPDPFSTLTGYVKFTSSNLGTEIKVPFSVAAIGGVEIDIVPPLLQEPGAEYDNFSLHFDEDSVDQPITILNVQIYDDPIIEETYAKFQSNDEEILHLMMTPIFYLWNPYNVEIVMDKDDYNRGAYEYFYAPPDVEFTFDNQQWISLKKFNTFQFGLGEELFSMWSSNNDKNRFTNGAAFEIPAGEFRYNVIVPPPYDNRITYDPYIRTQFFDVWETNYRSLFGDNESVQLGGIESNEDFIARIEDIQGFPNDFAPNVSNWLESINDDSAFDRVYSGVFSPILNYQPAELYGAGLNDQGYPINRDSRLKKVVKKDSQFQFGLKLKNQFFASRLSLGAGWNKSNPTYATSNAQYDIHPKRMIGALNIDTFEDGDSFDRRGYHSSASDIISVGYDELPYILEDGNFVGMRNAKKIALNVDIRAFSESDTPGKHAFYIDPSNNYYYDNESTDFSLALSPFRTYLRTIDRDNIIIPNPVGETSSIMFETIAGDQISKCVAKELPLIPLLSLTQLDHAPLGRDSEHFAYFSGRQSNLHRNNYEHPSLKGEDDAALFEGKEDRKMAPSFNMAVGNSWAHPTIPLNDIIEVEDIYDGFATDRSYLLNEKLFDSYFFTGLAVPSGPFQDDMQEIGDQLSKWINQTGSLPNTNYDFIVPRSMTKKDATNTISPNSVDTLNLFRSIANFIEVEGLFNVNSTSVDSWVAQLSSLRGKAVLYDNSDYGEYNIDSTNTENTPVLSQTIPAEKSLENSGGTLETMIQNSWSHYRSLEDQQLLKLAEEIVKQVKARGPFLSLSQFINREVSERKPYNIKGAIQTAIDESFINLESTKKNVEQALKVRFDRDEANRNWVNNADFTSAEIFEGGTNEGLPGYITQASLLRPLCPILSARSDTFIIRAYGDVKENGKTKARTWCEAVVQRRIDLINDKDLLKPSSYENDAEAFNRKFEVVSFRWLNADEI